MSRKNGFTLIELVVVMMIVGILAAIVVPNYNTYINQGAAQAAQNNLVTIYNAQKNYYFNNGQYYNSANTPDTTLNTNLSVNIQDNVFSYSCSGSATAFSCTAANNSGLTLTVTQSPIVLTGATTCASPATGTKCNPACSPTSSPYCP